MASIGPIIAVLSTGVYIRWKIAKRYARDEEQQDETKIVGAPLV